MAQKTMSTQSVWSELWQADPALYIALQSTTIINNALLTLFLVAAFSVTYDMLRFWLQRRTLHQRQLTAHASCSPTPEPPAKRPSETCKPFTSVNPKSAFYTALFLSIQYTASHLITHLSWILANVSLKNHNLRRRCSRLHARGLECSTAVYYHDMLNAFMALVLLVLIRAFELHVKRPRSRASSNCIPGFLRLQNTCRGLVQTLLAAPMVVVYVYTRAVRQRLWSCLRLLLVQAVVSCAVFLLGNFVCLVAALPDFQGTMEALETLGIMGVRG